MEILENSSMDQWRHVKGVENPADIVTRGMSIEGLKESVWLNGPAWLQVDEEKWPTTWCQVNELEPEQVTSTVATKTKLEQLFDWRRNSTFNRIRNFIDYCMRFKTKQKIILKADKNSSSRANTVSICSKRKLPECFEVYSKQQINLQNIKHFQIVTLHRKRWNN